MDLLGLDHDLEARKHLWFGLKRLSPQGRIAFLQLCCRQAHPQWSMVKTRVTSSKGGIKEVYMDLMMLAATHGFDLAKACMQLESVLRKGALR